MKAKGHMISTNRKGKDARDKKSRIKLIIGPIQSVNRYKLPINKFRLERQLSVFKPSRARPQKYPLIGTIGTNNLKLNVVNCQN